MTDNQSEQQKKSCFNCVNCVSWHHPGTLESPPDIGWECKLPFGTPYSDDMIDYDIECSNYSSDIEAATSYASTCSHYEYGIEVDIEDDLFYDLKDIQSEVDKLLGWTEDK